MQQMQLQVVPLGPLFDGQGQTDTSTGSQAEEG
jgi:hypothetical protein